MPVPMEDATAVSPPPRFQQLRRAVVDMALLQASRFGGLAVGLLVLPQYSRLLGENHFAIAGAVLSLQALLLVLDLGMSILVGRAAAASPDPHAGAAVLRTALRLLSVVYLLVTLIGAALAAVLPIALTVAQSVAAAVFFWALTVQNIQQTALLGHRHYAEAAVIQIAGVTLRGLGTLLALMKLGATLDVFIVAQTVFGLAHAAVTHWRCARLVPVSPNSTSPGFRQCLGLLSEGRPLMLFGLAGAAVMQLDKVLVASGLDRTSASAYYLAATLCLTPLTALAGPVAQYFQPRVIQEMASGGQALPRTLRSFVHTLVAVALVPAAVLWLLREPVVKVWLGGQAIGPEVASLAGILLPGLAVGSLGYVPYTLLVARQDYRFQSRASACMTIVTLLAAAAAVAVGSLRAVCWCYTAYHTGSTTVSWLRAIQLERSQGSTIARDRAASAAALTFLLALAVGAVAAMQP